MHIKIQGGGKGRTANKGSSGSLVSYLEHEDLKNIKEGKSVEPFFSHTENEVHANDIIDALDNNKKKLSKKDAKFYMITLSPSKDELHHLGDTPAQQSAALKHFVRSGLMQQYADAFGKDLNAEDIMYYGKVHYERGDKKQEGNLHVHIVVSRKTADGRRKISPKTNHRNTKTGPIRGGFDRVGFFEASESTFDHMFLYERSIEDRFSFKKEYKKAKAAKLVAMNQSKIIHNHRKKRRHRIVISKLKKSELTKEQIKDLFGGGIISLNRFNSKALLGKEIKENGYIALKIDKDGLIQILVQVAKPKQKSIEKNINHRKGKSQRKEEGFLDKSKEKSDQEKLADKLRKKWQRDLEQDFEI